MASIMHDENQTEVVVMWPDAYQKFLADHKAELAVKDARIAELAEAARWRKWPEERPEVGKWETWDGEDKEDMTWDGITWRTSRALEGFPTHWRRIDLPEEG